MKSHPAWIGVSAALTIAACAHTGGSATPSPPATAATADQDSSSPRADGTNAPCRDGVLVVYETGPPPGHQPLPDHTGELLNGDWDIAAQCLSGKGEMGWNEGRHSTLVSASRQREKRPSVISDDAGGAIIVVEISYLSGAMQGRSSDVVAQRIGPDGTLRWVEGQRSALVASTDLAEEAPVAVSDGAGGAIVFFEVVPPDARNGDRDIFAQRLGADGTRRWRSGDRSVPISTSPLREQHLTAIPDGAGGAYVAFEIGGTSASGQVQTDLILHRIDADGGLSWGDGKLVAGRSRAGWSARDASLVADGSGGVIVVFEAAWYDAGRAGDVDVLAARYESSGRALWGRSVPFTTVATTPLPERAPSPLSDGDGGVMVFFEVEVVAGERAGRIDIFGQRLDGAGAAVWNGGRHASPVSSGRWQERRPMAVKDGAGGAIVVYEAEHGPGQYAGDIDIAAQRVGPGGELMWLAGERSQDLASTPLLELSSHVQADGAGGVFVVYEAVPRDGEDAGDSLIAAQRVSADGALQWHDGKHPSLVAASRQQERHPSVVPASMDGPRN